MSTYPIETIRHSTAHLLASAVLELFPGTKLGVGPVIENGFFYDLDTPNPLSPQDLLKIEKRMKEIIKRKEPFTRNEMKLDEAIEFFSERKQDYKVSLLKDLKERGTTAIKPDEAQDLAAEKPNVAGIYTTGKFVDLCRGPHVTTTGDLGAFKLTKIAGAYWRGNEKNKMLTRVYGVAFTTADELNNHLTMLEEAKKRDHRKIGEDLELFTIVDEVGAGLPLFYPKGALVRRLIEGLINELQEAKGYTPIWVPHITKENLYKISGHLEKYDAMYPPMSLKDEANYYLKPMNCPHFMMLYKSKPHSYRELPLRWTCTTTVYRYEKSGELSGLTRVRALTQDDCHVFTTPAGIEGEIKIMLDLIGKVYKIFGFKDFWVRISTHDPANKEKYIGDPAVWKESEAALQKLISGRGWKYEVGVGEAAFYGPKLDFMIKDALGRQWQLSTIQLDMNLPGRFNLEYTDADGGKKQPVVIHRAILGSTERFLGILIEHLAGAFPVWLSPVQASIIPVGKAHAKPCGKLHKMLLKAGIRSEFEPSNDTVGYKIRQAEKQKIPYMLVVGDKEAKLSKLSVRLRGKKANKTMTPKSFITLVQKQIAGKKGRS
ncbi:MAG: threonine--tRNA ligase [Patescibacteria group bacterium]